jgi:hypothetical protein
MKKRQKTPEKKREIIQRLATELDALELHASVVTYRDGSPGLRVAEAPRMSSPDVRMSRRGAPVFVWGGVDFATGPEKMARTMKETIQESVDD